MCLAERSHEGVDAVRVVGELDGPAQQQCQRSHPHLHHVGFVVELGRPLAGGQRDPELAPESRAGELEAFDRRAEYVVGDDDAPLRRDEDAFGPDRAVCDPA